MKKLTVFLILLWTVPLLLLAAEVDTTRRAVQLELPLVPKTVAGPPKARTGLIWHTGPQVFYQGRAVVAPGQSSEPLTQKNLGTYTPIASAPQTQQHPFPQKVLGAYTPVASAPQSFVDPPPQKALGQYTPVPSTPGVIANLPTNYLTPFATLAPVPVGVRSQYLDVTFSDWTGGLNLSDFPENIADNQALEMVNFVWSPTGKLRPRPGFKFRKDKSVIFGPAKKLFGLYNYHAPNDRNMVLTAISDTLYADTNETGTYVVVKSLGDNSKYYDFATFKGKTIVAHEGDYPFWFDGTNHDLIGVADSGRGTLILSGAEDSETCRSFILTGQSKFTFPLSPATGVILPPRLKERARWRRSEVALTAYDRSNVIIYEPDQWAGYPLRFVDTLGTTRWHYIESNIEDTLTLQGQPNYTENYVPGKYYIYSYFDYDKELNSSVEGNGIITGDLTTGDSTDYCQDSLTVELHWFNCAPISDQVDSGLVLRIVEGVSAGQERFIVDANSACTLMISAKFDTVEVGDSIWVYKKRFWKPGLVEIFKNRIFFANIANYENLVVFSSYNKLGDFPPDNHFVVRTQDGDKITALATFFDDQLGYKDQSRDCLVIFKENSTWKLVWNSPTDYSLVLVSPNVGCSAKNSIANVDGKYLVFLHRTGVYGYDGRSVQLVSGLIDPVVKSIARSPNLDGAAATYYDNHYYLSYRDSSDTYNDQCVAYNTLLGGWTEIDNLRTWLFANRVSRTDSTAVLFVDGRDRTLIYEFDNRFTADTTAPIDLSLQSKAFDFNSLQDDKVFSYFDLDYYLPAGTLSVAFYTEFGNTLAYDTTVTQAGGYETVRLPLASDCIGRNLSFKISSSNRLELGKASLEYKKLED